MPDDLSREFEGKVALITGGARSIGSAIARELSSRGASVALVDICGDLETIPYPLSSTRQLDTTVKELSSYRANALGLVCDVRSEQEVKMAVQKSVEQFGRLDFLVNNAGVSSLYPIVQMTESAWNEVVDTCLKGAFFCCKHALPHMIDRHYGKIVNISSVAGLSGLGLSAHYCAAKHGIIGLTKALAMEVADHNINVNVVCPGTVESSVLEGLASQVGSEEDSYQHFSQGHLFKDRRISPEDIARAVRWLLSEESRCLTGAVLNVDAGWSARG